MVYNIREYSTLYTGNKGSEENAVVAIIMNLLNKKKFDSIDDVLKYNGKDLRTFLKNNNRDVIPFHYGNNLKNSDFEEIIINFKKMVKEKLDFNKDKINTTKFENKQYVEYKGKVFDNSYTEKNIEEEMKYMQQKNADYQSLDHEKNTDNIMNEMFSEKKREINFETLSEINRENLNEEEQKKYDAALVEQHISGDNKKLSIEDGLTKNEEDHINKIDSDGNSITINDGEESIEKTTVSVLSEIDISSLTTYEKDIFEAALNYQLLTDEVIRLDLTNMLIITPYDEVKEIITKDGVLVVNDERIISGFENNLSNEQNQQELEKVKVKKLEYPNPFYKRDFE